jgi:hypothetical protein
MPQAGTPRRDSSVCPSIIACGISDNLKMGPGGESAVLNSAEEGVRHCQGPAAPKAFVRYRRAGPVAFLALLAGCANGGDGRIFDYVSPVAHADAATPTEPYRKTEKPRIVAAFALLGAYETGPGYTVQSDVRSDGRYNIYMFATAYGTYPVTGDHLARKHIQELIALDALKKRSEANEFVYGVGSAVTSPVNAVLNTVADPVGTTEGTYTNIKRRLQSVQRSVSEAGEFVTTFGNPEQKRPDREADNLIEKFFSRPKAKRRLAAELLVDPYTHFTPLADELDRVASYSAAGHFGISTAVDFVPGVGGTIISSLETFDSFTKQTLDMDPSETAAINRERLKKLGMPEDAIKTFLLNDKLTPTEKTLAVGCLNLLSATTGLGALLSFIATRETRHDAFAALQALSYLSTHPFGDDSIHSVEVIDQVPIITTGDGKAIALFTSDHLVWSRGNADQLSSLGSVLDSGSIGSLKKEIRISGTTSPLAKQELLRQGWIVKTNVFYHPG